MLSRQNKLYLKKLFSLFSVVRGYNIFIIVVAQYLSAVYILAPQLSPLNIVLDRKLFILVFASSLAIAAGYIINNFYDSEKDLINRPQKTKIDRLVSQKTKLSVYFTLNIITVLLASYVSFKASLFFSTYIFFIWFYSHKLKKYPFIGNITASMLAIIPFFIVLIHYANFKWIIVLHGIFLIAIISMREITKDLENLKGDLALNYQTIPVSYGIAYTKKLLTAFTIFTILAMVVLAQQSEIGKMYYFLYFAMTVLVIYLIKLWKANTKTQYVFLHNLLKFIIVTGVFSIVLINTKTLLNAFSYLIHLTSKV